MPQDSPIYANSRIAVLSTKLIKGDKLIAMLESPSFNDALKVLSEINFAGGAKDNSFEQTLEKELADTINFVKEMSANAFATDSLFVEYDYLNAKVLVKGKYMRQDFLHLCNDFGLIDKKFLSECILSDKYEELPQEMADALNYIDQEFFNGNRLPNTIDVALDKAMFQNRLRLAKKSGNHLIKEIITFDIDFANLLTFFRCRTAKLDYAFFSTLVLPGGNMNIEQLKELYALDDNAVVKALVVPEQMQVLYNKIMRQLNEMGSLAHLEVIASNAKRNMVIAYKYHDLTIEPLINYYLSKKTEIDNLRLVLVSVKSNIQKETVKSLIRELYVG